MQQSFTLFGRTPSLSCAELYHYQPRDDFFVGVSETGALVQDAELGVQAAEYFGGVPKSGIVLGKITSLDAAELAPLIQPFMPEEGKFHFGISVYAFEKKAPQKKVVKQCGIALKKILRAEGASVRFVESKGETLSSADVVKNGLVDRGVELCLFALEKGFVVCKTTSVQPFEQYAERDYGRPGRDMKRGMLPPKLARSMLQLARVPEGGTILDPFCGVGTVLQEAALLGYKTVGTDIDEQAIAHTLENLAWLTKEEGVASEHTVEVLDSRKLTERLQPQSVDAVVTEFDLGPPLQGGESRSVLETNMQALDGLYTEALGMIHDIAKQGARVVIAWPYFAEQRMFVPTFEKLASLGFTLIEPYPASIQQAIPLSERGTILYGRSDQKVFREILILEVK